LSQRVQAAGYAAAFHTTHCHKPVADCCLRLVLPFSHAVPAADGAKVRAQLIAELGIPADPQTKDLARLYFFPSAPEGARVGAGVNPGSLVDVDAVLARARPALALVPALVPSPVLPAIPSAELPDIDVPVNLKGLRDGLKAARFGTPEAAEAVRRILKGRAPGAVW
jgi:hypothetical protein